MPHAIIEYSANLTDQNTHQKMAVEQLLTATYEGTLASDLFSKTDIKVRAIPYTAHQSGANFTYFIHVTLRLLAGRTVEQRDHLSKSVLEALSKQLSVLELSSISISVEVCDIETASYNKMVKL